MLPTTDFPLGEWLPAQPDFKNPGCVVAHNVVPRPGGYGPLAALAPTATAITGAARGSALFFDATRTPIIVAGTATSLHKLVGSTLTGTTGLADIGTSNYWDFARYNQFVIATALAEDPQYLDDLTTDTAWSDLPGTPPKAACVARVSDFLMLGRVASFPNRLQWSAVNAPTASWTPDRQTMAGFLDLPLEFGGVQRIAGGRYALALQDRAIHRIEYVGPPRVFAVREVERGRGTIAPFSVVTVGFLTFFLSQEGFCVSDGASVSQIGNQRVNDWFFREADEAAHDHVQAAVDWRARSVVWSFRSAGATANNRLLFYSWAENRFSAASVTTGSLVATQLGDVTLEQIDALYATLEGVPGSLDDARFKARNLVLAAWVDGASTTVLAPFDGPPMQADFETGEFQVTPGKRAFLGGARALSRGSQNALIAPISYRNNRAEVRGLFRAPGVDGFSPLRSDGVTHRVAVRFLAGAMWRDAQGVQVRFRPSGGR